MGQIRLVVSYDGVRYLVTLSEEPLTIGRAPDNSLSLTEPSISWHHATIWVSAGQVWIQDLNSTNGTTLDGERLQGAEIFAKGATVLLGEQVSLRLTTAPSRPQAQFAIEDLRRGRRFALSVGETDLVGLGVAPSGTVQLSTTGQVSLWLQGAEIPLVLGEVFTLEDARFQVLQIERDDTVGQYDEPFPYRLTVRLESPRGPEAVLLDRPNQFHHRVTSENRVVLLYLLARQVQADLAEGRPAEDVGWCSDEDLAIGIWGKGTRSASILSVLVHRLRKELDAAGLDHQFIEKSRKILRARLRDVIIE